MHTTHRDGLSNRLRLLAAYMVVAEEVYDNSRIVMVWELNEACVGHFLEIFKPLQNVSFISASQRPHFEPQAVAHFGPSYAGFLEIMHRFHLDNGSAPGPEHWHTLRREKYSLLAPVSHVLYEVFQFVKQHHICRCIGVHVRHTDLDTHYSVINTNHSSDAPYFTFIDSYSPHQCVYLMTDNPTTQHIFLRRYRPSRLFVYDAIRESSPSAHHLASHRFTSVFHTLVDVLISAYTHEFKGSAGSSLSELVELLNVTFVHNSRAYSACSADSTDFNL
jgi:hypothetical protein